MSRNPSWIFSLSPDEKLRLIEELWDDLSANPTNVPVQPEQIDEVERRAEKLKQDPASALTWEDIQRRIRR